MNNRKLCILALVFLMIFIPGCSNRRGNVINPPTQGIEDTTTPTEKETEPVKESVVQGITEFEWGDKDNQSGDVSLVASIVNTATLDGLLMNGTELHKVGKNYIISYSIYKETDESVAGADYNPEALEMHLALYDRSTGSIKKDIAVGSGTMYTMEGMNQIWCINSFSEDFHVYMFDENLECIREVNIPELSTGYISEDGKNLYNIKDRNIYRYDLTEDNPKGEQIETEYGFVCSAIDALYTGVDGRDYLVVKGMCGDLKEYQGTIDTDTGDFVYLQPATEDDYYNADYVNGTFVSENVMEDMTSNWIVYRPGNTPVVYSWPSEGDKDIEMKVMDNGNLLFYYLDGDTIEVAVFDRESNLCVSNTSFSIEFNGGESEYISLVSAPIYIEDDVLVLEFTDAFDNYSFFRWELGNKDDMWTKMSTYGYDVPENRVVEVDNIYDPSEFHPGEVPEELKPLREEADRLQDKHGVLIHISKECSNMMGGYAITSLDDYNRVERALKELDEELDKYPEGFFAQFKKDGAAGIDIYIASTLIGYDKEVLEYAGGFQSQVGSQSIIVIDCTNKDDLPVTIHHEISHAIDRYISSKGGFNEQEWSEYNPEDKEFMDFYTYSYSEFGYEGAIKYTYYGCKSLDDVYFIDDYSMTYPAEDRARLWENIMSDSSIIEWENTPNLILKINYYAMTIRENFDTSGWEDVVWERYIPAEE